MSNQTAAKVIPTASDVDVVFLEPLDPKYECIVCKQVLRFAVQFEECGHRCCSDCLHEVLKAPSVCPEDEVSVSRDRVYIDKAFQREVDSLGIRCSHYERGCVWTGMLQEVLKHIFDCPHRLISCTLNCGMEVEFRYAQKHQTDDCAKRSIQCQFCKIGLVALQEILHLEECPKFPVPCPNNCKKREVLREELAAHLESKCVRQELTCPFTEYGCEYAGVKRRLREHLTEDYLSHLNLLCTHVKEDGRRLANVEKCLEEVVKNCLDTSLRVFSLENFWGAQFLWKIDNYHDKFTDAKTGKKTAIYRTPGRRKSSADIQAFGTSEVSVMCKSIPFYSGRQGYRLAMSALLYGDGKARGKYMSLFICICRGDYDALLAWPFACPITFTLLDQSLDTRARHNISYVLKPNACKENKPFLGRPAGERNASIGAQKFAELDLLNTWNYIRDDTIFIKVNVDVNDMAPI